MMTTDFLGDIGEGMLHERSKLRGMVDLNEGVQMIAHHCESDDAHAVQVLRAPYHPKHELVGLPVGTKKEAARDRSSRDFHD
ncbi:MAG: hypothetical protein ABIS92_04625 [Polyangia bacterium]